MSEFQIPVEHLFTFVMEGMDAARHNYVGPFGRRIYEKAVGGPVTGKRFNGKVLPLHATDYGRASPDGSIRQLEADVGLQADDGTVILMQYRGRMSPKYGPGQSRIQILFDAPEGPHFWLNGLQAIGYGEEQADGSVRFEVYVLKGGEIIEGPGEQGDIAPADRTTVSGDFLLLRQSEYEAGATRHTVASPFGRRFFTLAEFGGAFTGPHVAGQFLPGYSWSPHRMYMTGEPGKPGFAVLMHYDVKTLLRTDDGASLLMSYTGASGAYTSGAWMTATQFEIEDGPHAWLNEVQAVGSGRSTGAGAEYKVYALR